jgi:glycosyltransferase involved in cell wall biosynthesis
MSNILPRLAIISTYDELCGIASYTRALIPQLQNDFSVEVFDLDQYLLRHTSQRVQKLADEHIRSIVARLKEFDYVNIQLEQGTLGRTIQQIMRRFRALAKAAPQLSVTFHTVKSAHPPTGEVWALIRQAKFLKAHRLIKAHKHANQLGGGIYVLLRRLSTKKTVSVIVHSKRDMRLLRDVYRLLNVFNHPLSYFDSAYAAKVRASTTRASFPILSEVPANAKLIGTFGFLNNYKGFDVAIKALKYLPDDYHLVIFGGVHPQLIKPQMNIDKYIKEILQEANIGHSAFDKIANADISNINLSITTDQSSSFFTNALGSLHERIHFGGVLKDDEFAAAMSVCDVVAFPYIEIGQASSGPISIALDMGCRVLASRTLTFLQLARYHPGAIEFFDIGNFLELAQRIQAKPTHDTVSRQLTYNTFTNAAIYRMANGGQAPIEMDNMIAVLPAQKRIA